MFKNAKMIFARLVFRGLSILLFIYKIMMSMEVPIKHGSLACVCQFCTAILTAKIRHQGHVLSRIILSPLIMINSRRSRRTVHYTPPEEHQIPDTGCGTLRV